MAGARPALGRVEFWWWWVGWVGAVGPRAARAAIIMRHDTAACARRVFLSVGKWAFHSFSFGWPATPGSTYSHVWWLRLGCLFGLFGRKSKAIAVRGHAHRHRLQILY
jgi:hypothetical protein